MTLSKFYNRFLIIAGNDRYEWVPIDYYIFIMIIQIITVGNLY